MASTVNVLWESLNLGIGCVLVSRLGDFNLQLNEHVAVTGLALCSLGVCLRAVLGSFTVTMPPERSYEMHCPFAKGLQRRYACF